jgi:hypothetical protein
MRARTASSGQFRDYRVARWRSVRSFLPLGQVRPSAAALARRAGPRSAAGGRPGGGAQKKPGDPENEKSSHGRRAYHTSGAHPNGPSWSSWAGPHSNNALLAPRTGPSASHRGAADSLPWTRDKAPMPYELLEQTFFSQPSLGGAFIHHRQPPGNPRHAPPSPPRGPGSPPPLPQRRCMLPRLTSPIIG